MDETKTAWPMGMTDEDRRSRPLVFDPRGFLIAILEDAEQAERARTTLGSAGFADEDLRIYTSEQIDDDHKRFIAERSGVGRVVGAFTDDRETMELYFGYARDGRSALWVRTPDKKSADRAVRALTDHDVLHFRYYGSGSQMDIHLR